jgi:hypothetical protein
MYVMPAIDIGTIHQFMHLTAIVLIVLYAIRVTPSDLLYSLRGVCGALAVGIFFIGSGLFLYWLFGHENPYDLLQLKVFGTGGSFIVGLGYVSIILASIGLMGIIVRRSRLRKSR